MEERAKRAKSLPGICGTHPYFDRIVVGSLCLGDKFLGYRPWAPKDARTANGPAIHQLGFFSQEAKIEPRARKNKHIDRARYRVFCGGPNFFYPCDPLRYPREASHRILLKLPGIVKRKMGTAYISWDRSSGALTWT
jgi:hypothetical protein